MELVRATGRAVGNRMRLQDLRLRVMGLEPILLLV